MTFSTEETRTSARALNGRVTKFVTASAWALEENDGGDGWEAQPTAVTSRFEIRGQHSDAVRRLRDAGLGDRIRTRSRTRARGSDSGRLAGPASGSGRRTASGFERRTASGYRLWTAS
jgi:hypothetical protein